MNDQLLTKPLQIPTNSLYKFKDKIKAGLKKTRNVFWDKLKYNLTTDKDFDEQLLPQIEHKLLLADVGPDTTTKIITAIKNKRRINELPDSEATFNYLRAICLNIFANCNQKIELESTPPTVILLTGVNGVGKTSTIGKLAFLYRSLGQKVLIAAADTFRAAAVDQLQVWAERAGVDMYSKSLPADPGAVIYEALQKGKQEKYDIILCDSSGRLQNKKGLMDELAKMDRVAKKIIPRAPHYNLLVMDATIGHNSINQLKSFTEFSTINGLIMTKLDSSAKGGILLGLVNEFNIPVHYITAGEQIDDIAPFDAKQFIDGLIGE